MSGNHHLLFDITFLLYILPTFQKPPSYLSLHHVGALLWYTNKNFFQPKVPPEWVTKPQDEEVVEGQDITFPCKVTGVPQPTVVWRKLAGKLYRIFIIFDSKMF